MSNEKPIITGDASKAVKHAAPETVVADKDKTAKMSAEPTAPTAKPLDAAKKS